MPEHRSIGGGLHEKPKPAAFNVVFATDRNYVPHLAAAICSLFENNRECSVNAYILNADVDDGLLRKLMVLGDRYGQQVFDLKVDEENVANLVRTHHFTAANYFRLFIPEMLPFERVLYLDADVIVNGPIQELYRTELGENYLAGVCEPDFDRHMALEMSPGSHYFNSGVMVMNLEKWRREQVRSKVIEFVKRKPEAIHFVDQCGTNAIINGQWKAVHPKYNLLTSYLTSPPSRLVDIYSAEQIEEAVDHPVIIHYTGSAKPWVFRRPHRYRSLYWQYSRKTPFRRYIPEGMSFSRVLKWCLGKR